MTITWPQNGWSKDEEAREAFTKEVTSVLGLKSEYESLPVKKGRKGASGSRKSICSEVTQTRQVEGESLGKLGSEQG